MNRDEIFKTICERMAEGESLRAICRDPVMPSAPTVIRWVQESKEYAELYARAREVQADLLADEMLDVVRSSTNETYQPDRLLVDALKWRAAKLRPKVYGDKQQIEHSGNVEIASAIMAARKRSGG